MADEEPTFKRHVLLNWFVSKSVTRAPQEHSPPIHGAEELLSYIDHRRKLGHAVEFHGATDDPDDGRRIAGGKKFDFIRLRDLRITSANGRRYADLLVEYVNQAERSFPVVNLDTYEGREVEADRDERGAAAAHVIVRLPQANEYEDGQYRCAIEAVHSVTRSDIAMLLSRQLLRVARDREFNFSVEIPPKGKARGREKAYRYHPKIDLLADVGRALDAATSPKRTLSHMVFVNRSERQELAGATSVIDREYTASVEVKVSAKEAPADEGERSGWWTKLRQTWENRGYETRVYYRSVGGGMLSGEVQHRDIEGAADLVLCPRELVDIPGEAKRWRATFCEQTLGKLRELVDRDELWSRTK
ncbi:MAG: hypothetical protein LCH88_05385 [Proteobacteria bacterium]|nr:hypothetical protein [Pseudomonadota bacterium]